MREHLLVSDLDDTLLGDDEALAEFAEWYEDESSWLQLAYASGRFVETMAASVRETELPEPAALIGGVGTEICRYPGGEPIEDWPKVDGSDWNPARIRRALESLDHLHMQPEASQSRFKVSYLFEDASDGDLQVVRHHLRQSGLKANLIYSSHHDLDVVPEGVDKGTAARHLADVLGVPRERVLVAGNSANDAAMFLAPFRGIVVGNAHRELKAFESDEVYVSTQTYARGVRDGIVRWTRQGARA
jgi:sucrose phosphatase-like protein